MTSLLQQLATSAANPKNPLYYVEKAGDWFNRDGYQLLSGHTQNPLIEVLAGMADATVPQLYHGAAGLGNDILRGEYDKIPTHVQETFLGYGNTLIVANAFLRALAGVNTAREMNEMKKIDKVIDAQQKNPNRTPQEYTQAQQATNIAKLPSQAAKNAGYEQNKNIILSERTVDKLLRSHPEMYTNKDGTINYQEFYKLQNDLRQPNAIYRYQKLSNTGKEVDRLQVFNNQPSGATRVTSLEKDYAPPQGYKNVSDVVTSFYPRPSDPRGASRYVQGIKNTSQEVFSNSGRTGQFPSLPLSAVQPPVVEPRFDRSSELSPIILQSLSKSNPPEEMTPQEEAIYRLADKYKNYYAKSHSPVDYQQLAIEQIYEKLKKSK
jgi:hypothetical protein